MSPCRVVLLVVAALCTGCASVSRDVSTLRQRVQELDDQEQIRQVLVAYGEFLDARQYAAYAALFARNGVWTGGFGSATGPAEIQAMMEKNLGKPEAGFINKSSFHLMTTMVVRVAGDTATAQSRYLFFTAAADGKPAASLAGRYVDEFVREDGLWKVQRRTTHGVIPWRDGNAPK